jgi:hypothetical protein
MARYGRYDDDFDREKKWVADQLRKLAAREALAGAHGVAVEHLFRAEAIEAGRDGSVPFAAQKG